MDTRRKEIFNLYRTLVRPFKVALESYINWVEHDRNSLDVVMGEAFHWVEHVVRLTWVVSTR